LELPTREVLLTHLQPFSILFVIWIIVFYIAGLYEKHTVILKSRLPSIILTTQVVNSGLAIAFFYLIPFFGITPKTILFIYLVVSFIIVLFWRRYGYFYLGTKKMMNAIVIGSGDEMRELMEEVNQNPIYNIHFISSVDLEKGEGDMFWKEIISRIYAEDVSIIAIDLAHPKVEPVLPHLYNLIFSNVSFVDMHKIYEDIFDRVPLSLLKYNWFLENISTSPRAVYDTLKRLMDIFLSFFLTFFSLFLYPFVILAQKLDDGGSIFIRQERVGINNKHIHILKFRSMATDDKGEYGKVDNNVTRVGNFLRRTRIDELPQLWNVLIGDISLIGPRPELPSLVKQYEKDIPYYNVRHIIKPGLSGWAQIYHDAHPHHGVNARETKNKLSYDLYYIKNRSFLLYLKIALRTLKTLISIAGR
jgi:lipopolysaccharide/colanic/teichoic acid biosynthesis glycosyltransferase